MFLVQDIAASADKSYKYNWIAREKLYRKIGQEYEQNVIGAKGIGKNSQLNGSPKNQRK